MMGKRCCCCIGHDVLIVTCNENQTLDDPYDVVLNGNTLVSVAAHPECLALADCAGCVPGCAIGCNPADGAWIATDDSIRPNTIVNLNNWAAGQFDLGLIDNIWDFAHLNKPPLVKGANQLTVTATGDAGYSCGNWGTVSVFTLAKIGNAGQWQICEQILSGDYQYLGPPWPFQEYQGWFNWAG